MGNRMKVYVYMMACAIMAAGCPSSGEFPPGAIDCDFDNRVQSAINAVVVSWPFPLTGDVVSQLNSYSITDGNDYPGFLALHSGPDRTVEVTIEADALGPFTVSWALRHELQHAIKYLATGDGDAGHTDPQVWNESGGESSSENQSQYSDECAGRPAH